MAMMLVDKANTPMAKELAIGAESFGGGQPQLARKGGNIRF